MRRLRGDDERRLICLTGSHTLQPSSPAKAGDPVFRDVSDRPERPRRTGSPAFAEDDRERRGCPTGKSAKSCPAQLAKIFRFALDPNHFYTRAVLHPIEGRIMIVTNVGCGMRWTLRCRTTNDTDADGKAVWSWRPDAGVKSCGVHPQGDGGKQARSPGRARNKP